MAQVHNLGFKYYNTGKEAVRGISFEIPKGEITALLGPSGCGKSTILNLLAGLLGDKGEIIGSINIEDLGSPAVVFQKPVLLPWKNVLENVIFPLEKADEAVREEAKAILKRVGLEERSYYLPGELSLGMQQRVNFGRALMAKPGFLLLDEPFSGLDAPTRHIIQRDFLREMEGLGITSLLITHDPEEAFYMARNIIILSDSPGELKKVIKNDKVGQLSEQRINEYGLY